MTRKEFVYKYLPVINPLSQSSGILPGLVIAQAIIESADHKGNFGKNPNAEIGNNYFGIKASKGWKGKTFVNPYVKTESNIFRAYDTIEDSIKDYYNFLLKNKRYRDAGLFEAKSVIGQADALMRAGYSTDQNYAALINSVYNGVKKFINDAPAGSVVAAGGGAFVLGALFLLVILTNGKD